MFPLFFKRTFPVVPSQKKTHGHPPALEAKANKAVQSRAVRRTKVKACQSAWQTLFLTKTWEDTVMYDQIGYNQIYI